MVMNSLFTKWIEKYNYPECVVNHPKVGDLVVVSFNDVKPIITPLNVYPNQGKFFNRLFKSLQRVPLN